MPLPTDPSGNSARLATLCGALESTWYEKIPITNALGVRIESFDGARLSLRADFEANINLHGTAFAGSLYAINALCGWSMLHLQLALADLKGSIVLAEGNIRYTAPVRDTILATCAWPNGSDAFESIKSGKKKARVTLTSSVEQDGQPAVRFEGRYAVLV